MFDLRDLPVDLDGGTCRLTRVLGRGGMATIYEAGLDPARFDWALLLAQAAQPGRSVDPASEACVTLRAQGAARLRDRAVALGLPIPAATVAVKVLHLRFSEAPEHRRRFRDEWQTQLGPGHPHLVTVYGGGVDPRTGAPWYAMELVAAALGPEDLHRLSVARKLELVAQAARGLAALHARGVVHRDVKPANLLVSRDPRGALVVKVADLGIAKHTRVAVALTGTSAILGSPHYMSPEQTDQSKNVTVQSDVWSLGATLYHLLGAVAPYHGLSDLEIMGQLFCGTPPRPLVELTGGRVPDELDALVGHMMAFDPASRPADMGEVVAVLEAYLAQAPVDIEALQSFADAPTTPHPKATRVVPASGGARKPGGAVDAANLATRCAPDADAATVHGDTEPTVVVPGVRAEVDDALLATRRGSVDPNPVPLRADPRQVGRYRLVARLGEGATGEVWRARDPLLNRDVAIKRVRGDLEVGPQLLARFYREAESVARLRHPAIVPVYEAGEIDGRPFLVGELLPGATLADRIAAGRPSIEDAVRWTLRLAEALDYAHRTGVVHRDVKPANILMDADGEPALGDFGLAMLAGAQVALTRTGAMVGTPAYMAPEQARGDTARIGPASDVYALGVVLFELLAGRRPFSGDAVEVILQVQTAESPSVRRFAPAIPRDLDAVCQAALARDVERRYPSAGAFALDLRRVQTGAPVHVRPLGPMGRSWRFLRANPAIAATLGIATTVVLAVSALAARAVLTEKARLVVERDRAEEHLARAVASEERAREEGARARAEEQRARAGERLALVNEADARVLARDSGWRVEALAILDRLRRTEPAGSDLRPLRDRVLHCRGTSQPAWRRLAATPGTGDETAQLLAFAASAERGLAVLSDATGALRLYRPADAAPIGELAAGGHHWLALAFGADGRWLLGGSVEGALAAWDLGSPGDPPHGVAPRMAGLAGGPVMGLAVSGTSVAVASRDGSLRIFDYEAPSWLATGDAGAARWTAREVGASALAFSPSGRLLASGGADRQVRLWQVGAGTPLGAWTCSSPPSQLAFSQERRILVAIPELLGYAEIDAAAPGEPIQPRASLHQGHVQQVLADDPHGAVTAATDGKLVCWNGHEARAVARGAGPGFVLAARAGDGRYLAVGLDGSLELWELAHPAEVLSWRTDATASFVPRGTNDPGTDGWWLAGASALVAHPGGTPSRPLRAHLSCVVPHPGSAVMAAVRGKQVELYSLSDARPLARLGEATAEVADLAFAPDGRRLAAVDADGFLRVWPLDGTAGDAIDRELPAGPLHRVAWTGDGLHLAVMGQGGALLATPSGDVERWLSRAIRRATLAAASGDALAISTGGGLIEVHDLRAARSETSDLSIGDVRALAYSRDGKHLAASGSRVALRIWDQQGPGETPTVRDIPGLGAAPAWLAFDASGALLACGGPSGVGAGVVSVPNSRVVALDASPAGDSLRGAFGSADNDLVLEVWGGGVRSCPGGALARAASAPAPVAGEPPPALGSQLRWHGGPRNTVWGVATSPDGRLVATTSHDGAIHLWDARDGSSLGMLGTHAGIAWCAAFSPDSRTLATGGSEVIFWDLGRRAEIARLRHGDLVYGLAYHPEGRWLAVSRRSGSLELLDMAERRVIGALAHEPHGLHGVEFDPRGHWLAASGEDHRVLLWDCAAIERWCAAPAAPLAATRRLSGHAGPVWTVAWSPDAPGSSPGWRWLASGDATGRVVLRRVAGDRIEDWAVLESGIPRIRSLSWSPDSRWLAAGCYASSSLSWDLRALTSGLAEWGLDGCAAEVRDTAR